MCSFFDTGLKLNRLISVIPIVSMVASVFILSLSFLSSPASSVHIKKVSWIKYCESIFIFFIFFEGQLILGVCGVGVLWVTLRTKAGNPRTFQKCIIYLSGLRSVNLSCCAPSGWEYPLFTVIMFGGMGIDKLLLVHERVNKGLGKSMHMYTDTQTHRQTHTHQWCKWGRIDSPVHSCLWWHREIQEKRTNCEVRDL